MAALSESKLGEELRKKRVRAVYALVGEDPFKLDHYSDLIAAALGDASRESAYGDELDPAAFLDDALTLSLWTPHKLVLVRQAERITAKTWEGLLPLLEQPPERCTVVFQCAKADGRMKFFQQLAKAKDECISVKLEPASGGEWSAWAQTFLRELGRELQPEARALLQEWTSGELGELRHLLERAALFAGGGQEIRAEHVRAVGYRATPEEVFRFTGMLLSGDSGSSLGLLEALLRQGEEPIALVGLLARQYRWLLAILALRAEGKSDQQIASEARIFPAAARELFPAARRLGGKKVVGGLAALAEADHALKSSRLGKEHVMTRLVLALTA